MKVTLIGIDLAKNIFQTCGVNQAGKAGFNRQVRRAKLLSSLQQYPEASIAMEACSGSNYWGRELKRLGFNVMLIPPQHVKPFVKGNKNDRNDAFAICEAARRPGITTVEPRSLSQTDTMVIHRIRERKTGMRTAVTIAYLAGPGSSSSGAASRSPRSRWPTNWRASSGRCRITRASIGPERKTALPITVVRDIE